MALILQDRVRETTNTTGTGTFTLLGAVTGYQSFSVIGNGNTCFYACADQGGPNWEVGLGTYSSGTLARTTVLSSSNSGSLVNFTAGTKDVFVTQPSEKAVYLDGSGNITPSSVGPLTVSSLTDSGLTSGRVTYAGTGGLLQDSANLTFNGTTLTANTLNLTNALTTSYGGTGLTSFTAGDLPYYSTGTALSKLAIGTSGYILQSNGSAPTWVAASSVVGGAGGSNTQVQFNNSGVLGGSANLTWNGTTLGVTGAITASADSAFNGTGALQLPVGTTAQQPTGASGKLRFNSTTSQFEGYTGSAWSSVGGSALSNDTTTATNLYPLFANATTGTALNVYTSNAKYLYKPSTGDLQSSQLIANNGLVLNNATVSTSYTVATGNNAMSVGPITVATGQTVTVSTGQRWVIL